MFLITLGIKEYVGIGIIAIVVFLLLIIIVSTIKGKNTSKKKKSENFNEIPQAETNDCPLNQDSIVENDSDVLEEEEISILTDNKQPVEGEFVEEAEAEIIESEKIISDSLEEPEMEATYLGEAEEKKELEEKAIEEPAEENKIVVEETKANSRYAGKFEVFQEGSFYKYRLKASNGEVLVVSQMYKSKDSAYRSIESLKRNVVTGNIRIVKDKTDMYTFKLVAKNHRVMAISSHYGAESRAKSASESFQRFALSAKPADIIVDANEVDFNSVLIERKNDEAKDGGKYFIVKDPILDWCWTLSASNGQVLCQADSYTTKAGAQNAIINFKSNVEIGNFYVFKGKGGRFQFKLFSPQGRLVVLGESYPVKASAESAANSVCSFYKKAILEK